MISGLSKAKLHHAVMDNNERYDGIFYFASPTTGLYCRPSCISPRLPHEKYAYFDIVEDAEVDGYQPCKQCHPGRLKNNLSSQILGGIDAGAINDKGVHGLADSLHISERHLRRLVHDRTGSSPVQINKKKRLNTARKLITQTKLPIIDVAFHADFASLRQFNDAFKTAFEVSPSTMRKSGMHGHGERPVSLLVFPLKLAYSALSRIPKIN